MGSNILNHYSTASTHHKIQYSAIHRNFKLRLCTTRHLKQSEKKSFGGVRKKFIDDTRFNGGKAAVYVNILFTKILVIVKHNNGILFYTWS